MLLITKKVFNLHLDVIFWTGNHTIAIVQTTEDYESLKLSLSNVIKEVNDIEQKGYIEVDKVKLKLELFLGGDYKVLY